MSNTIHFRSCNPLLGIKKLYPDVELPTYATDGSACFDIKAYLNTDVSVVYYSPDDLRPTTYIVDKSKQFPISMGERAAIPTGMIFDIPDGYSVRLHLRSGIALKLGLMLVNGVGVIDADYTDPIFILVYNPTEQDIIINHGDRIAQAELVPVQHADFTTVDDIPQKGNRIGGLGSTGR